MSAAPQTSTRDGLLHIGAVCNRLRDEFPDVSISKIRYLEDQGLLHPKRTRGGYRLFDEDAVERLRTILRLQRDEFLPLRVIRQELASPAASKTRRQRQAAGLAGPEEELSTGEIIERSGATPQLVHELEEYGLLEGRGSGGEKRYAAGDAEIAAVCAQLASYGIGPRNLRAFRTAADRQVSLLGQLVGPSLRTRNPERREAALDDLRALAELAQELSQLLSWRALRQLASA
ncbi:MAG TPA: MerR family transcriptional regulator [Gaiellaceae bacterium]|jgi:DNA-binding transcriptional MerR regulator